ncbi:MULTISPECIES: hypothetical protein [Lysinibacillus]|uniref:hypothetical protein n=1 Tax=Lysinibacillus TaxID=400634 RepID=UPI00214BA756|nr:MULTISPECIES: hypothetical protein [Lysinibacillus]UNT55180.1 hypothetical protein ICJ70_22175 [Lysinibacillus capsici]UUV24945.1 hypothetical protein NP781_24985 [Lysinibacillus sp. FN11]UYB47815.1 hypothetical protein OCI51_02340 [Lysinibacillus capsici]
MQYLVRIAKTIIYGWLAIILACNIYGVETIFSFIPNIKVTHNSGELQFLLDKRTLQFTFHLAILEALDNYLTIRNKYKKK